MDEVAQNRAQQAALYGAPLNEVLGHCAASLGVTQSALAGLLGISAPMVSQLINGHRIKIANPAAAQRLRQLSELVAEVDAGRLRADEVAGLMQATGPSPLTMTQTRQRTVAVEVQELFRGAASAADYLDAAKKLRGEHPEIAELLLVYGTERADRAEALTQRLQRPRG
ncbi:DNA-binding protein [Luteococcus sp. H138]|uniref:DNA-binding protein n=1 Tax=unclassified Luteococcus TaxID=2639923 RepID=UPI00313ED0FE